jgi:hypothetical protein
LVEIKSTDRIAERDVAVINRFQKVIPHSEALCLSLDPDRKKIGNALCVPWTDAMEYLER